MYFDSDFASVEWNDEVKVAVLKWKKFASEDNFKTPCNKALELAKEKKATKWYSDTTELGVLTPEDTDWFMKTVGPAMLENGISKQALIVPKSLLSKMSLDDAAEKAEGIGLETKMFDNSEEALNWLKL